MRGSNYMEISSKPNISGIFRLMNLSIPIKFTKIIPTEEQDELLRLVVIAHQTAATDNQNASTVAFVNAYGASGSIENGIASAVLTIGNLHAPIFDARIVYETWHANDFAQRISSGLRVPGFGNSFFKDRIDPAWEPVDSFIRERFPDIRSRIRNITQIMSDNNRAILPNAAMYSAAVCSELKFTYGTESAIFIMSRIPAWLSLLNL